MKCSVDGCNKKRIFHSDYCCGHDAQVRAHGEIKYKELRQVTGRSRHYLYSTWTSMRDRCNNPRNRYYENYGGRGISVCDRWMDHAHGFENFIEDMGDRPEGCSLDRVDNNGDYSPENCRWSNRIEQNLNKRTNRLTPYISTRMRYSQKEYLVRIKDLRDKTGHTVRTRVRRTLEDAIVARDELLAQMRKDGAR